MQWLELTIQTKSCGIDLVASRLTVLGFDSFIIDDQEDFQSFLENNRDYWDYVDQALEQKMLGRSQIRLYLEDGRAAMESVSLLRGEMQSLKAQYGEETVGCLEISLQGMQDEDWENNWKQYYQPIAIGEKLLVVPQWMQPDNPENRIPVILDPGMIFGTGAHASTQMCMRALEKNISGGETVIDLGSGSGILSITALLLGAESAVGVDIDPKAEDIARENAAMNDLDDKKVSFITGDVIGSPVMMQKLAGDGYDIVLANIVADVIIPLSRVVLNFLRKDGVFICSGILDVQLEEVKAAIEANGLRITEVEKQDDWCRITAVAG